MAYVVIDHHHDPDAGVYRLVIGREVTDDVPVEDPPEEGPFTETKVIGHDDVRDFVFADTDERWQGRSDEDIAADQRALVLEAVTSPVDEVIADAAVTGMPGVGEAL
jgi:hypothetical protein